jgi:molybdate transport system substrate-binding protein
MSTAIRILVPEAIHILFGRLVTRLEKAAGEAFDVGLTNPHSVEALIAAGLVDGTSHRPFGRVRLAIGRRESVMGPVLTDLSDIAVLLRDAASIGYTGAGTSGCTYLEALARFGLSDTVTPKSRPMGAGEPCAAVAVGQVELAVAPLTAVLANPGVAPAAIFPEATGTHIDMSVFRSPTSGPGAAAVVAFLTAAALDAELGAAGVTRFEFG